MKNEKLKKIIRKIEEGKSISEIAKEEKINRYSISLVKQTKELYVEYAKRKINETISECKKTILIYSFLSSLFTFFIMIMIILFIKKFF